MLLEFVDILFLLIAHPSLMLLTELLQIVTCEECPGGSREVCMFIYFFDILCNLLSAVIVHIPS